MFYGYWFKFIYYGKKWKNIKAAGSSPQQPCPCHLREQAAPGEPQRLDAMDFKVHPLTHRIHIYYYILTLGVY